LNKQRLEAFSDGVFAIVITLLILNIHVPDVPAASLGHALLQQLPQVFTYVLSFFVVALYWLAHHRMSHLVKQVDGAFIWMNMTWLLFVSVIPFPTALLDRYPLQAIPIAIYGADLILANILGFLITLYLKARPHLVTAPITEANIRAVVPVYVGTNGAYAVAIALGWFAPWGSYLLFAGVLVYQAIRYAKIANPFAAKAAASRRRA
jgi:uncharacterized membrane protein